MATHSSVLAWRVPGMGEPVGLPCMGSHRVGHDWSDLAAAAAVKIYENFQKLTAKKEVLFIIGNWNAKEGSQEIAWSNRQVWHWRTKWSRPKANGVVPRECTGHSKHLVQQHKRRLYTLTSPDGQLKLDWLYSLQPKMEKLYTISKHKTWSWLWFRSWASCCKIQA